MDCELCNLKKLTHWYFECDLFIICDCLCCNVPMYVWKNHNIFPTIEQRIEMYNDAKRRFPDKEISLLRRKIPDHFHFHMR